MSKPTLVQTLLNRPSQTYTDPSLSEYFTPNSSPRSSMPSRKPSRRSLADAATTSASSTTAVPSTRTPTGSSSQRAIYSLSTGSSLSSTSLDAHSIFSDYLTPAGSIDDIPVFNSNHDDDVRKMPKSSSKSSTTTTTMSAYGTKSTVTPNRSAKAGPNKPTPTTTKSTSPPSLKPTNLSSSAQSGSVQQHRKPSAKEPDRHSKTPLPTKQMNGNPHRPFNAFAPLPLSSASTPNQPSTTPAARQQSAPQPNDIPTQKPSPSASKPSTATNGHAHRDLPPHARPPSTQTITSYHNRRHNTSKIQNSIMMNMSALLEEDEDGGDNLTKRPALRHTTERGRERKRSQPPTSLASSSSSESASLAPASISKNPPLQRRRSRSLDSGSSRATTTRPAPQTLSAEVQALTLASHGDLPSIGTQGYTSLLLPRAPMPLFDRPSAGGGLFGHFSFGLPNLSWNKDGKVDLTRSGIAQTTMASVEVVRGLSSSRGAMFGRSGSWKVLGALGRRGSTNSRSSSSVGGSSDETSQKPRAAAEGTILGFTSYRPPPSYVPSQSVLLQVWAVGLDGVDGRLVGVRFGSTIPATGKSELGEIEQEFADESLEVVEVDAGRDNFVTNSTASQQSTTRNPFMALGRSLSLSLKRPKKDPVEEQKPQIGRSFSLRPSKKPDPNSLSISTPGSMGTSPATHAKHSSSANATPSSTPEKKRSGSQLQHQRSKHQESSTPFPPVTPPKLPSKPQKLKAKTKAVPVPTLQVHMETQTQIHSSPVASSSAKDKQVTGTPAQRERQASAASTPGQNSQPSSTPSKSKSPAKSNSKPRMPSQPPAPKPAEVGFIPGRSFVGRVLEVGWELGDEVVRKGEWVVGLVDVRKCGALAEFIVVDRHRIHRVPHPRKAVPNDNPDATPSPIWVGDALTSSPQSKPIALAREESKSKRDNSRAGSRDARNDQARTNKDGGKIAKKSTRLPTQPPPASMLTLEEMALLPLCGIPAYRAVRTFMYAFSGDPKSPAFENPNQSHQHRRRALILRGHDGAGAMAVQMLIRRGWRVSVHVPFSCVPADATQDLADEFMRAVENRAREWGADEVIFDDGEAEDGDDGRAAAVRVIETLREEGDVFDAILDTVGGKEVREAGERLLRSNGSPSGDGSVAMSPQSISTTSGQGFPFKSSKRRGIGLFTTLVGDTPERPIPSAADLFRANLRSFRFGLNDNHRSQSEGNSGNGSSDAEGGGGGVQQGMVGYAWVSVAHEVSEWEGADVRETLGGVLGLAMEDGIRPLVEDIGGGILRRPRVVPFEKTPGVFVDNGSLGDGGTLVVRIAG